MNLFIDPARDLVSLFDSTLVEFSQSMMGISTKFLGGLNSPL